MLLWSRIFARNKFAYGLPCCSNFQTKSKQCSDLNKERKKEKERHAMVRGGNTCRAHWTGLVQSEWHAELLNLFVSQVCIVPEKRHFNVNTAYSMFLSTYWTVVLIRLHTLAELVKYRPFFRKYNWPRTKRSLSFSVSGWAKPFIITQWPWSKVYITSWPDNMHTNWHTRVNWILRVSVHTCHLFASN